MRVDYSTLKISIVAMALALVAAGVALPADANPRTKKTPKPASSLAQTSRSKTVPQDPKAKGNVSSDLDSLRLEEGDESANELKAVKTEMMVARTEIKAIEQAQKLIKKYKGGPLEAELQFRLAELHMRRAKTARFFEISRTSETVVRVAPQIVANANSRRHIESAIKTYDYIQSKFPRFKQLDLVVFNNGFARQQLGQEREAERMYWFLVQNFRNSPLVPDCHLAIGEINFDRSNFSFALEHFNAIKKFPESRVYPYGLYKAAWAYYNLRDAVAALKKLEEVVAYGKFVAEKNIEQRLDLRKEALADMTVFYEDVLPAQEAFKYFRKQASELDVGPIILKLAKLYEHHSRHQERQIILNDFINNITDSPHIASIHGELIWNYDAMKKKDLSVAQMEKLSAVCSESGKWMKDQRRLAKEQKAEDPRVACMNTLSDASVKLAGRWLKIWKKEAAKSVDFADASEKAFEIYLREPPVGKEAFEARFNYAELLFQRQKFRRASEEYAKVSNAKEAVGTLRHDASYAAVLSIEKAVSDKWSDTDEKTFQGLAKQYVDANPKGQFRLDLEFKMALIAYEKSRYDEAAPTFLRLGRDFASTEKGKKSQDLYLDILNLKKDYKGVRDYSKQLVKHEAAGPRKEKLQKIHEQAYFLDVQSLEEAKNLTGAIAAYKEFAQANPSSDLAIKAWWNAVNLHYKAMDYLGGAKAAEEYYDRFPKSANAMDALLKAAQSYESLGQLEPAADVLVKIAALEPKNATKWNSLAADFYMLSNRHAKAKKMMNDLRSSGDAKLQAATLDKLLIIERANGTNTAAYKELLNTIAASNVQPQASLAKAELVEGLLKSGRETDAFNEAKKIVGTGSASSSAKARARFVQAQVLEEEFLKQSVKSSRAEKVAVVLAIKTEKLEKAQQALQQSIKYGDAQVTVKALASLAGCYTHYVDAIKSMPVPAGFSKEDEQAFRGELSNLSIPLEEKAIETLQEGIRAAKRFKVDGPQVAQMRASLKKMNMPAPNLNELEMTEPGLILPTTAGVNL